MFFFSSRRRHTRSLCDWSSDVCSSDLISRYGSAPAFYTDRQRHEFFTARISLRQCPRFLYCPSLIAAAPPLFILTNSRCGSAPAFYTAHSSLGQGPAFYTDRQRHEFFTARISLRQRPCFLYCPSLVAAAPRSLY